MLKKLLIITLVLIFANQAYCQEMQELTPLQKKVRAIFAEIKNRDNVEAVKETEEVKKEPATLEVTEENTVFESQPEENRTEIIMASEQEQDETEVERGLDALQGAWIPSKNDPGNENHEKNTSVHTCKIH